MNCSTFGRAREEEVAAIRVVCKKTANILENS